MAKARVVLNGCVSYDAKGRKFVRGVPQIITDDNEILYYKKQGEFSVTMLKELKASPSKPQKEPEPRKKKYSKADLSSMTKTELIQIGEGEPFNLAMEASMKKPEMISALLTSQSLLSGEEVDDSEDERVEDDEIDDDDDSNDDDDDEVESDDD